MHAAHILFMCAQQFIACHGAHIAAFKSIKTRFKQSIVSLQCCDRALIWIVHTAKCTIYFPVYRSIISALVHSLALSLWLADHQKHAINLSVNCKIICKHIARYVRRKKKFCQLISLDSSS